MNLKESIKSNPEASQFLEKFIGFVKDARSEGFPTQMFEVMIGAFTQNPDLMFNVFKQSSMFAFEHLGQEREHPAAIAYPIATALKVIACQNPQLWAKDENPLFVKSWKSSDVLRVIEFQPDKIIELSGSQTMAKNIPLRAAFVFDLLGKTQEAQTLKKQPLLFLDLAASAGFTTTAFIEPENFLSWFSQQQNIDPENRSISFVPENTQAIGIDIRPSTDEWAVACIDDETLNKQTADFIENFPNRAPVFQGNALEFDSHPKVKEALKQNPEARPVIVLSMFMYQLPVEMKIQLAKVVRNFALEHNALIVIADASSLVMNNCLGWCGWVENGSGRITPFIEIHESPQFGWGQPIAKFENVKSIAQLFPESPDNIGEEFASGLRVASDYNGTQKILKEEGITEAVLNRTPPVGLNLRLLAEMPIMSELRNKFNGQSVNASILGIAIAEGVPDFQRFLQIALENTWKNLEVIDVDSNILLQISAVVSRNRLEGVNIRETDARNSGIETSSQQIVLRDHLGNCCPPEIDKQIDREVSRILAPGGISIVNITTSELLNQSPHRQIIGFEELQQIAGPEIITALRSEIFNLAQLKRMFGKKFEQLRGFLLEIEPEKSFVVFGEDETGHGEWFRSLNDHLQLFQNDGFEVLAIQSREGNDSHNPPLKCQRHIIVMKKQWVEFGFQQNIWPISDQDSRIQSLIAETHHGQQANISITNLKNLSQKALSGLTVLESNAFNMQMGESVRDHWLRKDEQLLFLSQAENTPNGFILLDNSLVDNGIFYLELVGVSQDQTNLGIARTMLTSCFQHLRKNHRKSIIVTRTKNPKLVMSIANTFKQLSCESFPFHREPNNDERKAIELLLQKGKIIELGMKGNIDFNRSIMHGAYSSVQLPTNAPNGEFISFLDKEKINWQVFNQQGDAFFVGGTL